MTHYYLSDLMITRVTHKLHSHISLESDDGDLKPLGKGKVILQYARFFVSDLLAFYVHRDYVSM